MTCVSVSAQGRNDVLIMIGAEVNTPTQSTQDRLMLCHHYIVQVMQ